ncbi:hypothetical protein HNP73_004625 [Amaricoccus macauensis]|uniref:Uncharacterized protein n=1 Tax=Amaricoccus macauensis TaxID=57001 RepID=A0A840SXX0_9RHOB|nr:hypothetical protein [Amaricoccus macauensis]
MGTGLLRGGAAGVFALDPPFGWSLSGLPT